MSNTTGTIYEIGYNYHSAALKMIPSVWSDSCCPDNSFVCWVLRTFACVFFVSFEDMSLSVCFRLVGFNFSVFGIFRLSLHLLLLLGCFVLFVHVILFFLILGGLNVFFFRILNF